MVLTTEYDPPSQVALYHLSAFADIGNERRKSTDQIDFLSFTDADGELEHLLPVCMDTECRDSRIYVREYNQVSEDSVSIEGRHPSVNFI